MKSFSRFPPSSSTRPCRRVIPSRDNVAMIFSDIKLKLTSGISFLSGFSYQPKPVHMAKYNLKKLIETLIQIWDEHLPKICLTQPGSQQNPKAGSVSSGEQGFMPCGGG